MNIFTYIHDAIVMVLRDNRSNLTQYIVGCVLILLLVGALAYLLSYFAHKKEKQRAREKGQDMQKRKRAGKYPKGS
ncbi:MAG: hypothetical protein IJ461_02585 [Clostridia bacterium]|nr:hypothetical protein [Clostridia bacterium]